MIGLARLAVCSTLLAVCAPVALAESVNITGNVSFSQDTLTFAPPFATQADTGVFSAFSGGTVNYMLGTVFYTLGLPQTALAFTITNSTGDVLSFYDEVNSPTQSYDSAGNLDVVLDETGYYTINGGDHLAGSFNLGFSGNTPTGSTTNVAFLGTGQLFQPIDPSASAVTPEPNSLLLLSTGLLASAVLLRSSRRRFPALVN